MLDVVTQFADEIGASHLSVVLGILWWLVHACLLAATKGQWYRHMYTVHAVLQFAFLLSDDWADLFIFTELAMYAALLMVGLSFCVSEVQFTACGL